MSAGTLLFLFLRALHVLLAALWIGGTVFMAYILMPTIQASGPAGGQIMLGINKRGLGAYFGVLGGVTALSGVYLLWRFTGGFSPEVSRSTAGMVFGIGGVAGILATILGGAVVGRSARKATTLLEQAQGTADGPAKGALMQQVAAEGQKMEKFGTVVILLQMIALLCMALGHYV
jgi:uncharacterized membrane protein